MKRWFADEVNPTGDEISAWAYSGDPEPYEDFDTVIADPANAELLVALADDETCPMRDYARGSLYCMVGHSDLTDLRLSSAVRHAASSPDVALRAWASRADAVLADPTKRVRSEWCSPSGLRTTP
jgi:hypothetical protein